MHIEAVQSCRCPTDQTPCLSLHSGPIHKNSLQDLENADIIYAFDYCYFLRQGCHPPRNPKP